MVDVKLLSDKELRDLLLHYDPNLPPVNANTRSVMENKLERILQQAAETNDKADVSEMEVSEVKSVNISDSSPPRTPPMVRFENTHTKHVYENEYTPSYCRKSLNEYRDKVFESPKYNLLDKPGYTPHANKHGRQVPLELKPSKGVTGVLTLILLIVAIVIGVYFLLTWDPSFSNPLTSN